MKPLKKIETGLYHYENGERIKGKHKDLSGDCSRLYGDCSNLCGDLNKISAEQRKEYPSIEYWAE